ncbi:RimK family alpha-L-glutamate ligase [Streptomyces sp. G44]|uniref:RimK family alpha-L-glutamate ligase n=1 Tax=Streptomyces sp. G44 TaxID=2807632 RepID=UPI0027DAE9E4|nr:RimK family alpha-L-glutamate ligase [Streptomyces sp. G44]
MTTGPHTPAEAVCAVFASRVRTDEKRILEALDRRKLPYVFLDSRTVWQSLDGSAAPAPLVLNREIGYARALYGARALEAAGCVVVNSARATEICGDKYRTSVALRDAGIPTPRTALALTPEAALPALDALGYPAVIKPLVGSWGRLVSYLPDAATARTVLDYVAALPGTDAHIVYVQEYVFKPERDIRAVVIGDEAVGAVYRSAQDWRTNVARGAVTSRCELTGDIAKLAVAAAQSTGADVAGVDLLEGPDGELSVLEVNHGVEFSGFQRAHGGDLSLADLMIDLMEARLPC